MYTLRAVVKATKATAIRMIILTSTATRMTTNIPMSTAMAVMMVMGTAVTLRRFRR